MPLSKKVKQKDVDYWIRKKCAAGTSGPSRSTGQKATATTGPSSPTVPNATATVAPCCPTVPNAWANGGPFHRIAPKDTATAGPSRPILPHATATAGPSRPSAPNASATAGPSRPSAPNASATAGPSRPSAPNASATAGPSRPSAPNASDTAGPSRPPGQNISSDGKAFLNNDNVLVQGDVPVNILNDQFGMLGFESAQQIQQKYPALAPFIEGLPSDILVANMTPSESFPGPLGHGGSLGPQELPPPLRIPEYDISARIHDPSVNVGNMKMAGRDEVTVADFEKYPDCTLFYAFYTFLGDALQILAANELYRRNWRYEMKKKFWFTKPSDAKPSAYVKGESYEKGDYFVFDESLWKSVKKRLIVSFNNVEGPPAKIDSSCLKC